MESKFLVCTSCNSRLKVPASLAPGKKVKCPKCSNVVSVPAAAAADVGYAVARDESSPAPQPTTLAPAMKTCPFCGEQVLAGAVKCRHCGEFIDADKTPVATRSRATGTPGSRDDMNPAEYVVATLFCPIGLFIGFLWKLRNLGKANDMLKISGVSCVIALVAVLLAYNYVFKKGAALPTAPPGVGYPGYVPVPPGYDPDDEPDAPRMPGGAGDLPPPLASLDQQPPEIRRAMKANVRILHLGALGSGVVIRREAGRALILTNRHVVDPAFAHSHGERQTELKALVFPVITYVTGENEPGKVVWAAPDNIDLALLEAGCPEGVEAVSWQSSDEVQIGEEVFAVGNPAGLGWTYTRGVVSQLREREYGNRKVPVVQTDTRIGPGNSGGGLYNEKGELIGINTFVLSASRRDAGETGLGFAIRKSVLLELKPDVLQIPKAGTNQ